jgi:hypothetical protein
MVGDVELVAEGGAGRRGAAAGETGVGDDAGEPAAVVVLVDLVLVLMAKLLASIRHLSYSWRDGFSDCDWCGVIFRRKIDETMCDCQA